MALSVEGLAGGLLGLFHQGGQLGGLPGGQDDRPLGE
jgi:hypothetical protein